ncbi:unnamed protein product [Orchesella dallaii]|uniref:Kinetochore protein Nuf2 n=1 Tax=Orchesella dallaii TaxID=48710 RepID=A0ABP1RCU6_9HEXA
MSFRTPNSKSSNVDDNMSRSLKILVVVLNEQDEEGNYMLGKKYHLEDFDYLTSNEMVKIVVRLTKDIIPHLQTTSSKLANLNNFAKFQLGGTTYDNEIDRVYNTVKRILPADIPIHYSAFLLPAKDPKLTKSILIAVMSFFIMSDNFYERFAEEFDEVTRKALEKAELFNEIEDIQKNIDETVQIRIRDKERVPVLDNEIKTIQKKIREDQKLLAKTNDEVAKVECNFKNEELELNTLTEKVKRLEAKKSNLNALLVPNPQEILNEKATLKKQLMAETAQRDACSSKVSTCRQKVDEYEVKIQKAENVLHGFETAIPHIEKVKQISREPDFGDLNVQLETLKLELDQLQKQYNASVKEFARKEKYHERNIRNLTKEVQSLERRSTKMRAKINQEKLKNLNIKRELEETRCSISAIKLKISQYIRARKVDIPTWKLNMEQQAKENLEQILETFGDFSLPPP